MLSILPDSPLDVDDPIVDTENNLIPNIMKFKKMRVATRLNDRQRIIIYLFYYFTGFIKKYKDLKCLEEIKNITHFFQMNMCNTYELDEIG